MPTKPEFFLLLFLLCAALWLLLNGIIILRRGSFTLPGSRAIQIEGRPARLGGILLMLVGGAGLLSLALWLSSFSW